MKVTVITFLTYFISMPVNVIYLMLYCCSLPGKEALFKPGKKSGDVIMIREPRGIIAYTWVDEGVDSRWEKIGDVLGGTDKNQEGKTIFEGKVIVKYYNHFIIILIPCTTRIQYTSAIQQRHSTKQSIST